MKIQDIIIWILVAVSVIIVGWYFFGNSPTFEQAILVLILTLLFTIGTKTSSANIRLELLEKRFNALARDFKEQKHK